MALCPDTVSFLVGMATYTITFISVVYASGNSVWCYRVTVTGSPGLSHWVLGMFELCPELLAQKVLSVTRNGVPLLPGTEYELGTSDGVTGIKFEVGVEASQSPVQYCVTLEGEYTATAVDVAVKGGPGAAQKQVDALCGPSCTLREDSINQLLESVALEEAALAHLVNAEAEKVQWALGTLSGAPGDVPLEKVIALQHQVGRVLRTAIKYQMLLQFKLEDLIDAVPATGPARPGPGVPPPGPGLETATPGPELETVRPQPNCGYGGGPSGNAKTK